MPIPEGKKRVNFNTPIEKWEEFKKVFPYNGEVTAFFNRCIETAILTRKRKLSDDEVDFTVKRVKEEVG